MVAIVTAYLDHHEHGERDRHRERQGRAPAGPPPLRLRRPRPSFRPARALGTSQMNGRVNEDLEPLLRLVLRDSQGQPHDVEARLAMKSA